MLQSSRKPLIIGVVAGVVLGVLLGMVLFWQVWPVRWTSAHSYDLAPEAKAEYITLLTDSYRLNRDYAAAASLLELWTPEEKQEAFASAIGAAEARGRADQAQAIRDLALVLGITAEPRPTPTQPPSLLDRLRVPCLVFVLVLLALVLGWIGLRLLAQRRAAESESTARAGFTPVRAAVEAGVGDGSTLGRWITTYKAGESAYDESYPIEAPGGEYLGECGVGISEVVSAHESDKVTALEVWLFDKSDIRTVNKVLLSEHAYHDKELRSKLASKGEAVLVEAGTPFFLETSGLEIEGVVTDLEYGKAEPAPNSYFSRITIELAARAKAATEEAEPPEETQETEEADSDR